MTPIQSSDSCPPHPQSHTTALEVLGNMAAFMPFTASCNHGTTTFLPKSSASSFQLSEVHQTMALLNNYHKKIIKPTCITVVT